MTNRDVNLTLNVEAIGQEKIKDLQAEIDKMGKEAGEAKPQFEALSAQVEELSRQAGAIRALESLTAQVDELRQAQTKAASTVETFRNQLAEANAASQAARDKNAQLKASVLELKTEIAANTAAYKSLQDQYKGVARQSQEYKDSLSSIREAARNLNIALLEKKAALADSGAEVTRTNQAVGKLETALRKSGDALDKTNASLERQSGALANARKALDSMGVASESVAQAQDQVVASLNRVRDQFGELQRQTQALTKIEQQAEEQRKAAAEMQRQRVEEQKRAAVQAAELERRLVEQRKKSASDLDEMMRELARTTAEQSGKMQRAFDAIGIRNADEIRAEIDKVKASLEVIEKESGLSGRALNTAMAAGAERVRELERELRKVTGQMTTADRAASALKNSIGQIAVGNLIASGVAALVGKLQEMAAAFVDVVVKSDSLKRALTSIYESSGTAAQQIEFLRSVASRAGVSMLAVSDSFVRFSAATRSANLPLEVTNELFEAVTRASATLGLSSDKTARAIEALGQMASKGVVSMEELRQQLGDNLPGALSAAAKGMGLTDRELVKLVETGRVMTADFFPGLTKGLQNLQGDGNSLTQTWGRLLTAMQSVAMSVGESGGNASLNLVLKSLAAGLGVVTVGVQAFYETIRVAVSNIVALKSALTGDFKIALDLIKTGFSDAYENVRKTSEAFYNVIDPAEEAKKEIKSAAESADQLRNSTTLAADALSKFGAVGDATAKAMRGASSETATLISNYQAVAESALALSKGQGELADVTEVLGDANLTAGQKIQKLGLVMAEQEDALSNKIALGKLEIASDEERAKSIVKISQLRGTEISRIEGEIEANNLLRATYEKQVASRDAVVANLARELDAKVRIIKASNENVEARQKELDQLVTRLSKAKEERDADANKLKALEAEKAALDLKNETLGDSSARIAEYKAASEEAARKVKEFAAQVAAGGKGVEELAKAQEQSAVASAKYSDALSDMTDKLERLGKRRQADLELEIEETKFKREKVQIAAEQAKRAGEEEQYRARLHELNKIDIELESKRIAKQREAVESSIQIIESKRKELEAQGPLTAAKKEEIETELQVERAKLKSLETQELATKGAGKAKDANKEYVNSVKDVNAALSEAETASKGAVAYISAETQAKIGSAEAAVESAKARYEDAKASGDEKAAAEELVKVREAELALAKIMAEAKREEAATARQLAGAKLKEAEAAAETARAIAAEIAASDTVTDKMRQQLAEAKTTAVAKAGAAKEAYAHADALDVEAKGLEKSVDAASRALEQAQKAYARVRDTAYQTRDAVGSVTKALTEQEKVMKATEQAAEGWIAKLSDGVGTMTELEDASRFASQAVGVLGESKMSGLINAIDTAKQKMQELEQSAQAALSSVQDELDQLNANYDDIERRRYEQKQKELQDLQDKAKAAKNDDAAEKLREAMEKNKQVYELKLKDAKEREQSDLSRKLRDARDNYGDNSPEVNALLKQGAGEADSKEVMRQREIEKRKRARDARDGWNGDASAPVDSGNDGSKNPGAASGKTVTVNVNFGGVATPIQTSSEADAQRLIEVINRFKQTANA